jgi:hypothetical protein
LTQRQPAESLESSLRNVTHRELALADPVYFNSHYLDQWYLPHRARLIDFLTQDHPLFYPGSPVTRQFRLALLPRDHLKTSTVSGLETGLICRNPNVRCLNAANTMELARQNVGYVKAHLEHNPRIRADFGDLTGEPWGKEKIQVRRTSTHLKEPTVIAAGLGTAILGMHFDLIWLDDIIKTENQWTEEMREKVWLWFSTTLIPCLDRHGLMVVTGTRKHLEDLYSRLMVSPQWSTTVSRAIIDEATQQVLEPFLYSYDRLVARRSVIGDLEFAQEYQNEPIAMKGLELKREWLRHYDPNDPPQFNWTYMGIDPAVGKSDTASYTATCLLGVTPDLKMYVLDFQRHRWHVQWEDKIIELWQRYVREGRAPLIVAVESVMTFRYVTQPLVEKSRMPVQFVEYRQKRGTQVQDELARIRALGVHFSHGRIYLPDPDKDPMSVAFEMEEYLRFPSKEGYTDMLNALNLAVNLAPTSVDEQTHWGC